MKPEMIGNSSFLAVAACVILLNSTAPALAQVPAACGEPPRLECKRSEKSRLRLEQAEGRADRLVWKWLRGNATELAEFGDPTVSTDYALCFYAGGHADPIAGSSIPADPGRWKAIGQSGFKYSDRKGPSEGIRKIVLKAGPDGKAKIARKGVGASLPDPVLPLDFPLLVQLVNSETSACWEDTYDGADLKRNDASRLRARAGPEDPTQPLPALSSPSPRPGPTAAEAGMLAYVGSLQGITRIADGS